MKAILYSENVYSISNEVNSTNAQMATEKNDNSLLVWVLFGIAVFGTVLLLTSHHSSRNNEK